MGIALTPFSLGPLKLGMSRQEVEQAVGAEVVEIRFSTRAEIASMGVYLDFGDDDQLCFIHSVSTDDPTAPEIEGIAVNGRPVNDVLDDLRGLGYRPVEYEGALWIFKNPNYTVFAGLGNTASIAVYAPDYYGTTEITK